MGRSFHSVKLSAACLATQAVGDQQATVALDIEVLHVVEQTAATADHHEQATTGVVVMLVVLEVLVQVVDTGRQDRDLDFGRAAVRLMLAVGCDGRGLVDSDTVAHGWCSFPTRIAMTAFQRLHRAMQHPTSPRAQVRPEDLIRPDRPENSCSLTEI